MHKQYKIAAVSLTAFLIIVVALVISPKLTFAQGMMGGFNNIATTSSSQIDPDETAGKAIWDQLQNKQTACQSLRDDDFDKLGDFFMGNMMGSSHDYMDQLMAQRLGEDGEKQMHIVMGKRLSSCDIKATFPQGAGYFMPMMGGFGGMMGGGNANNQSWSNGWPRMMGNSGWGNMMNGGFSSWSILGLLTWGLVTVFLILGIIYFWRGIKK